MPAEYLNKLFNAYNKTHTDYLDSDDKTKIEWFNNYARKNYFPHLNGKDRTETKILEIGCNKGYLLKVFLDFGFEQLFGIDLSPDDVEKAKILNPGVKIECADAFNYLDRKLDIFDVIVIKAVLEHIPKNNILLLLEKIKESLNDGGIVIIDVPNMDWLFASHERYMDFTHEVGFTKESLSQLLRLVFSNSIIIPVDNNYPSFPIGFVKLKLARFFLGKLLSWADPEGASNPIWCRSMVGVGQKINTFN